MTKEGKKIYARVSGQGTAMDETGLCEQHLNNEGKSHAQPHIAPEDGEISPDWQDCTGNDALSCQVCGYPEDEQEEVGTDGKTL